MSEYRMFDVNLKSSLKKMLNSSVDASAKALVMLILHSARKLPIARSLLKDFAEDLADAVIFTIDQFCEFSKRAIGSTNVEGSQWNESDLQLSRAFLVNLLQFCQAQLLELPSDFHMFVIDVLNKLIDGCRDVDVTLAVLDLISHLRQQAVLERHSPASLLSRLQSIVGNGEDSNLKKAFLESVLFVCPNQDTEQEDRTKIIATLSQGYAQRSLMESS